MNPNDRNKYRSIDWSKLTTNIENMFDVNSTYNKDTDIRLSGTGKLYYAKHKESGLFLNIDGTLSETKATFGESSVMHATMRKWQRQRCTIPSKKEYAFIEWLRLQPSEDQLICLPKSKYNIFSKNSSDPSAMLLRYEQKGLIIRWFGVLENGTPVRYIEVC